MKPTARNVLRVFRAATPDQFDRGMNWYTDAAVKAEKLAAEYGRDVSTVAAVIAATSPVNSWGNNLTIAERIIATNDTSWGYLKIGLRKCRAILDGVDPLDVLTSDKIRNFYLSISARGVHPSAVCVDRHAYSIAINRRVTNVGIKGARYAATAAAYVRAAQIVSRELGYYVAPAQVQAVTWVVWRQRYWAIGAWDGES